jgi:hypothetical protein
MKDPSPTSYKRYIILLREQLEGSQFLVLLLPVDGRLVLASVGGLSRGQAFWGGVSGFYDKLRYIKHQIKCDFKLRTM